jgi:DNA polymerase III delta subunit
VPSLNLAAFKKQVAERLAPVYLFVGEDLKLSDRLIDDIESSIDPLDRPFAVDRFYAGEAASAPADIAAAARTLPMLGDRRVVLVLRAERILKPRRAKSGKSAEEDEASDDEPAGGDEVGDATALEEYIAEVEPSSKTTLVFVASDVDRSRRLTKRLLEKAQVVECGGLAADGPGGRRDARAAAREWLEAELGRAGRTIDPQALQLLIDRAGNDITKLRGDVERLLLFVEASTAIGSDDVLAATTEYDSVDDEWAVVNAIAAGDAAAALVEVGRRFERGDSPHGLVGQLRWWVANRLAQGDPRRVRNAFEALLRTDLALKSSGGEGRVLVERLVVELTGKPVAQARWPRR